MDELLMLVTQYAEARQLLEAAQAEMDELKNRITAELARRDVQTLDVGSHKVTVRTVSTTRIDGKALKAAAPGLFEQFSKTTVCQRFTVT